jgi:ATP-dependent RNA helicase TDRD9
MKLPDDVKGIPVQAIECYLAGVRPGYGGERDGFWSKDSVNKFCEIIDSKQLLINVYSEINGILRVDLWDTTNPNQDLHINELLVQMRWAVYAEEPLLSKLSHEQLDKSSTQQLTNLTSVSTLTIPWPLVSTSDWEHYNSAASSARLLSWRLNGPTNPYEVSFYAMTKAGGLKSTRIDGSSVNSMVLNDEPQDKHHRLMVAATVALNATGNTVLARNTTLLPNIHGLGHLLCLLFAPTVELRVDPLKRQYTGAICGLGCDFSTGVSLYPDHDMEIIFDAIISQDDMTHINEIRSQMNLALESSESMINWGGDMIRKMQADIKSSLLKLVLQLREPLEPTISPLSGWNLISPDDLISTPSDQVNPPLYSIHSLVNISGSKITSSEDTERIILLKKVKELQHKASRSKMLQSLTCPMCNVTVPTPYDLMVHINSKLHKTFEQKLEKEIQDARDSNEPIPITTPTMWKQMVNN